MNTSEVPNNRVWRKVSFFLFWLIHRWNKYSQKAVCFVCLSRAGKSGFIAIYCWRGQLDYFWALSLRGRFDKPYMGFIIKHYWPLPLFFSFPPLPSSPFLVPLLLLSPIREMDNSVFTDISRGISVISHKGSILLWDKHFFRFRNICNFRYSVFLPSPSCSSSPFFLVSLCVWFKFPLLDVC